MKIIYKIAIISVFYSFAGSLFAVEMEDLDITIRMMDINHDGADSITNELRLPSPDLASRYRGSSSDDLKENKGLSGEINNGDDNYYARDEVAPSHESNDVISINQDVITDSEINTSETAGDTGSGKDDGGKESDTKSTDREDSKSSDSDRGDRKRDRDKHKGKGKGKGKDRD